MKVLNSVIVVAVCMLGCTTSQPTLPVSKFDWIADPSQVALDRDESLSRERVRLVAWIPDRTATDDGYSNGCSHDYGLREIGRKSGPPTQSTRHPRASLPVRRIQEPGSLP